MSHIKKIWRKYIWEEIKKDRDKYFLTYSPINLIGSSFANLNIIFTNNHMKVNEIANIMEKEFNIWFSRFPLPLKVIAWDYKGEQISLKAVREDNVLMGYNDNNSIKKLWGTIQNDSIPKEQLHDDYIKNIYKGLLYENRIEKEKEADRKISEKKTIAKFIDFTLLIWFFVSIIIAFLGWQNFWVGGAAFIYSVFKTIKRLLNIKGYKTQKEKKEQEKNRKMKHYYYHCELNPKGFQRLKAENFEREEIRRISEEKEKINI